MARNRKIVSDDALTPPLVVLRKVDFDKFDSKTFAMIRDTAVRHQGALYTPMGMSGNSVTEGELAWFEDGYVLNDHPRVFDLTKEIMGATLGFAVARTDSGTILAEFGKDGLKDAVEAVSRATVQLSVDVNVPSTARARTTRTRTAKAAEVS